MSSDKIKFEKIGNTVVLQRNQWKGNKAYISDYPGLLNEVLKYTWSYTLGDHPYLRSSKLNISLHKFVLAFLYGQDNLETMLKPDNIIEHLDNNGLNCAYDNLHILSSDSNKAKAFTIDKEADQYYGIPTFITDIYYSHNKQYYQMQITFNRDLCFVMWKGQTIPIEAFFAQYDDFRNLFIDWLYIYNCRENGKFDISKFHSSRLFAKNRPQITLRPEEYGHVVIQRDGHWYLVIRTDGTDKLAYIAKTAYVNIEQMVDGEKGS